MTAVQRWTIDRGRVAGIESIGRVPGQGDLQPTVDNEAADRNGNTDQVNHSCGAAVLQVTGVQSFWFGNYHIKKNRSILKLK